MRSACMTQGFTLQPPLATGGNVVLVSAEDASRGVGCAPIRPLEKSREAASGRVEVAGRVGRVHGPLAVSD